MALDRRIDGLEASLARLARAQARTEAAVLVLARRVDALREALGAILEAAAWERDPGGVTKTLRDSEMGQSSEGAGPHPPATLGAA
jgi:hypothetical protein